jgi:hypothetical protein
LYISICEFKKLPFGRSFFKKNEKTKNKLGGEQF